MILWRIARRKYADLSGEGARRVGGRWNSPGLAACYLTEHPALALLEILVHLDLTAETLPNDYVLMTIVAPDEMAVEDIHPESYPRGAEYIVGNKWLSQARTPLLGVPSAVMLQSFNYILNPAHPDMHKVRILTIEDLTIDNRLASPIPRG